MVIAASGGDDYHLVPGSPYKGAGTDGRDVGADIDAVMAATAGVIGGVPTSPPPPSPPPPPGPPSPPPPPGTVWAATFAGGTLTVTKNGVVVFMGT